MEVAISHRNQNVTSPHAVGGARLVVGGMVRIDGQRRPVKQYEGLLPLCKKILGVVAKMRHTSYKSNAKTTSPPATVATPRTPIYLAAPLPDTVRPEPVEACPEAEALEGGPPPPAAPATPHSPTPHPDTSPFPPTPPNPYPTPMNTAPHTATTTTKAPANTHARSAQSTPPLNPNRPPGIVSPEKEQSRNATQVGQGNSTTPPLAPDGTLTRPYCPPTGASATFSPWQSQSLTATRTSRVPMPSGAPTLSLAAWSASMVRGAPSSNMGGCCPSAK